MYNSFSLLLGFLLFATGGIVSAAPATFNLGNATYTRVSQWSGPTDFGAYAIYRDGYVYAAGSDSFVVIRSKDQINSALVGRLALTNTEIRQITLVQHTAYLTETNGLKLIDISNPEKPVFSMRIPIDLSRAPYPPESPETLLFDNTLYITASDRLYSLDVTDPMHPGSVRTVFTGGCDHLSIESNRAYVSGRNGQAMYEYPSWNLLAKAPVPLTTEGGPFPYPVQDFANGVLGQGDFLYAFLEHGRVLTYQKVFGSSLVAISTNYANWGATTHGRRVWQDGDQIYALGGRTVLRFRIDSSGVLQEPDRYDLFPGDFDILSRPQGDSESFLSGSVSLTTGDGIYLFDFTAWPPRRINSLPASFSTYFLNAIGSVGFAPLGLNSHCIGIFDLSQTTPRLVSQFFANSLRFLQDIKTEGTTLYAQTFTEVHRFELKSGFSIEDTGNIILPVNYANGIRSLQIDNGRLFFLTNIYPAKLNIYDRNLTNVLSEYVPPDSQASYAVTFELFEGKGYLFMEMRNNNSFGQVYTLDLSDLQSPKVITNYPFGGRYLGNIARQNDFLFRAAAQSESGGPTPYKVDIYDLKKPLNFGPVDQSPTITNLYYLHHLPQNNLVRGISYPENVPIYSYWAGGNGSVPQFLGSLTNINLTGPIQSPFLYLPEGTLSTYVRVAANSLAYRKSGDQFTVYFGDGAQLQATETLSSGEWVDLPGSTNFITPSIRPSQFFRLEISK
jgi:hypothetical protein